MTYRACALLLLTSLLISLSPVVAIADTEWRSLIREVEDQHTGRSSRSRMIMQIATEHWQRRLEMAGWSLGRDYFLVRILEPAKERGVATLKADREVWNYLPKVDRVIKIPTSMMGGAWMGSHITNNDLVKESHIDEDYDFSLEEETEGYWRIAGIPKPDAAVIWGKIIYQIEKIRRVPQQVRYFDENLVPVRDIRFDKVDLVGERPVPLRMTVQPLDKPAELTVLEYRELVFDVPVEHSFFSLRNLKSRRP